MVRTVLLRSTSKNVTKQKAGKTETVRMKSINFYVLLSHWHLRSIYICVRVQSSDWAHCACNGRTLIQINMFQLNVNFCAAHVSTKYTQT